MLRAVLGAQWLTALADNALLIVAIAMLERLHAPEWSTPALRVAFYGAYVVMAPLVGQLADRLAKPGLMAAVNVLKLAGALALLGGAAPWIVFAAIGLGASAYAPARYGILPELASGPALLRANAAMEIVTIVAILAGTLLGSVLVTRAPLQLACAVLAGLYALSTVCTLAARHSAAPAPVAALGGFRPALHRLLADRAARAAVILTSLFWSAAAVLQFVLIGWSREHLGLPLAQAALLPAVLAIGMVAGAVGAGHLGRVPAKSTATAMALALGGAIAALTTLTSVAAAAALLLFAGLLAGALLVPLNALVQARGASLVGPGQAVAVQNFLENGLSLIFLAAYGAALALGAGNDAVLLGLGAAVLLLVSGAALRAEPDSRQAGNSC
jgi:LPLT family lysophospholipid transporter-like MFS transporter